MSLQVIKAFRGNFIVAFAGAALIIFLIKVTPLLLPAKFYFSFSSLMGSDTEPFIVEPPGVTGRKLCGLLEKYDIPKDRFSREINCSLDYVSETTAGAAIYEPFQPQEKDRIYTVALQGDPQLRRDIGAALQTAPVALPSEADVSLIIAQSGSPTRAFDKLVAGYKVALDPVVDGAVGEKVKTAFAADMAASQARSAQGVAHAEPQQGVQPSGAAHQMPPDTQQKVLQAYRNAAARLDRGQLAAVLAPITKTAVDQAIKDSYGWYGIDNSLIGYYKQQLSEGYVHKVLLEEFEAAGLTVMTPDEERRLIYAEINKFSLANYVVAILVRLAPVVIVAFLLGIIFGQAEMVSIGVAGAMAAFLLSWPLMLMWDRLVQSSWQDKKTLFLMFYAAYVVAFFLTARAGGMLGAKMREGTKVGRGIAEAADGGEVKEISWGRIAMNVGASVAANVAVYMGNVIIPLQAMADKSN
jgi:hypothetical protein